MISLVGPAIATGNTVDRRPVADRIPLAATDFYSVLETSDVPAGVINIVTGDRDALAKVLSEHDDVDAMWYFGARDGVKMVELASASNMKRTWATWHDRDWLDADGRRRARVPARGDAREERLGAVRRIVAPRGLSSRSWSSAVPSSLSSFLPRCADVASC